MYNVETIQQNLKAIATAHADYAKSSFEQGKTYVEQLAQVKSLDKAVELHTQYAKTAYETFVAEANKISDLYREFTEPPAVDPHWHSSINGASSSRSVRNAYRSPILPARATTFAPCLRKLIGS
jgi:phasin protein